MRQVGKGGEGGEGGGYRGEVWGMLGGVSEGQGLVLFGALLVCHHADQRLHGSAQIVGHVEQTANTGTSHGCPLLPP